MVRATRAGALRAPERSRRAPSPSPPARASPALSPATVLHLQRTAGNHAVLQRMSFVDVLGESIGASSWTEAKKKARAKEITARSKEKPDPAAALAQAGREVESAIRSRDALAAGTIPDVEDWVVMKKGLTSEEYEVALRSFDDFKGPAKEKERFLRRLPSSKMYLFTSVLPRPAFRERTEEEALAATPNARRAAQAKKELDALQAKDRKHRLTSDLISLMVWGVAEPRTSDDLGSEGILGIEQAVDAARALMTMRGPSYVDVMLKLGRVGGYRWKEERVQAALILKAVAARRSAYRARDTESEAREDIAEFAKTIRDTPADDLVKLATVRDAGGGDGLRQKFTMSCGPTSIQITRGESDPIYALDVSRTAKHSLDYENSVAAEQEKLLGKAAAPRKVADRWAAFQAALQGLPLVLADVPKWASLMAWMGGKKHDAVALADGKALAGGLGFTGADLDAFKKYLKGLQTSPGLGVSEFRKRIRASKVAKVTNDRYPLKQFKKGAVKESDVDDMWKQLDRGRDIMFGVYWASGGGHYMVLTDARGDPAQPAFKRSVLLSDPWTGTSEWLTGKQLAEGDFGSAGSGWIDDVYY